MKTGAPWHIKGVHRDAVDNAREAARRAGMSVGQWLNSVILESAADEDEQDDVYDDPYAPPAQRRRARDDRSSVDISAITDRLEGLTGEVERLAMAAKASRDDVPKYDATAQRLADAIAKLDQRVENFMAEGRSATQALGLKVESVDRALSALGRERTRAGSSDWATSVDQVVDEIAQRQLELEREGFAPAPMPARANSTPARDDFAEIHDRLRHVSEQVEAFGSTRMREAIDTLRSDLTDIVGKLTEASPRRAIETLEGEVRLLAKRLDTSSQGPQLSGIESGLAEVRSAIRALAPAESLAGAVDAIHVLSNKIDQMAAGAQDPAGLQQLETAIAGLRGIVSRVASDDSLAALTAEVRSLSQKITSGASASSGGSDILQTLEQRIGTIADAIESVRKSASSAGSSALEEAVRSLGEKIENMQAASDRKSDGVDFGAMIGSLGDQIERMQAASDTAASNSPFGAMLGSLSEKIERLQEARGDSDVLRQIEQRIGTLSEKLEASEAKLGNLDSIDRGMKELLVYLEGNRTASPPLQPEARPVQNIAHDVLRTQESLEAVHGTIGDVVDRLAMIETGMRGATPSATSQPSAPAAPTISAILSTPQKSITPAAPATPAAGVFAAAPRSPVAPQVPSPPLAPKTGAAGPAPKIDDILPHDHPLEPGSGKPRPGMVAPSITPLSAPQASPAERIAASKAVVEPAMATPPDPDAKLNFIVAARRAAQAAVEDDSVLMPRVSVDATGGKPVAAPPVSRIRKHLKSILVAASVVVIIVGALQLALSLFDTRDGSGEGPGPQSKMAAPEMQPGSPAIEGGSSGVLTTPKSPVPAVVPNAGVLPQAPMSPQSGSPVPAPKVLVVPEESDTPPATPSKPPADVTGTLVPPAPATVAAAPPGLFTAPQAASNVQLPLTIGGKLLVTAAQSGDPTAAYEIATRYSDGRGVSINPEAAATWFERAARAGLVPAIFRLGGLYEKGIGVKKDLNRARELYTAAADRGNAKAMHNLAVLYADGFEGKPDYAAAIQWFRKAAARGVPDSQYNLGVLYARGIGVEQNFGESFRWFALAAQSGDQDAAQKRDDIAKRMDPQTLSTVRTAVQNWTPEPQPDDAVTVKTPPGGWDSVTSPATGKAKSKRVQTSSAATPL